MNLFQDLRVAIRNLKRAPGAALTIALTVAVGVASLATVFAVVDALFLRPLPGVERPEELVNVHATATDGTSFHSVSLRTWRQLSEADGPFTGLAAFGSRLVSVSSGGEPRLAVAQLVTGNYFGVLGARAARGRLFGPETDAPAANVNVVVLSDAAWKSRLSGDPNVVGRSILVNGRELTVVGVAVPGFAGTFLAQPFDVWLPVAALQTIAPGERFDPLDQAWLEMVARRRPGVTVQGAGKVMEVLARRLESSGPRTLRGVGFDVRRTTGFEDGLRGPAVAFFTILFSLALLVLAIAGANVTGLLLARGLSREKEIGIRLALGAGRIAVARLILVENLLPFLAGGGLGVALTFWTAPLLERFDLPTPIPIVFDFRPGLSVALFGLAASAAAGLLFGSLAAWAASRPALLPLLKAGTSTDRRGTSRLRAAFVSGELAFSVLLLVAAGLFRQTVRHATTIDPGFDPRGLTVTHVDLSVLGYEPARARVAFERLTDAVRRLPLVESAAVAAPLPLGPAHRTVDVGLRSAPEERRTSVEASVVGKEYFETLRIPILRGRGFGSQDRPSSPAVAVVNETFARMFFQSENAVGQTVVEARGPLLVVGVARDGKYRRLSEPPRPFLFVPSSQSERLTRELAVRGGGDPRALAAGLRRELHALDPAIPFSGLMSMDTFIKFSTFPQRVASAVSAALGAVGLALAAIGLAGLVADSVGRRTREIGLRLAIGARPRDILSLEIRRAARLGVVGFAVGAAAAALGAPLLRQFVFGARAVDPLLYAVVALLLGGTILIASYFPARRAARLDPIAALRAE